MVSQHSHAFLLWLQSEKGEGAIRESYRSQERLWDLNRIILKESRKCGYHSRITCIWTFCQQLWRNVLLNQNHSLVLDFLPLISLPVFFYLSPYDWTHEQHISLSYTGEDSNKVPNKKLSNWWEEMNKTIFVAGRSCWYACQEALKKPRSIKYTWLNLFNH